MQCRPGAFLLVFISLLFLASTSWAAKILDVRVGKNDEYTRLVIELDEMAEFQYLEQGGASGPELVISVKASAKAQSFDVSTSYVRSIQVKSNGTESRVRLQLPKQGALVKELVLKNPVRIVLDISAGTKPGAAPIAVIPPEPKPAPVPAPPPTETKPAPVAKPTPVTPDEPAVVADASEDEFPVIEDEDSAKPETAKPKPPPVAKPKQKRAPPPPPPPESLLSKFAGLPALILCVVLLAAAGAFVFMKKRRAGSAGAQRDVGGDNSMFGEEPWDSEESSKSGDDESSVASIMSEYNSPKAIGSVDTETVESPEPDPFSEPAPAPAPSPAPAAAPVGGAVSAEIEQRIQGLEDQVTGFTAARERLEAQIKSQAEELRVQRAAIARTQRVVRSLASSGDDDAPEPVAPKAPPG